MGVEWRVIEPLLPNKPRGVPRVDDRRVLIEIVGAEHRTGTDILIITGAILLLSFAVLVLRFGSYKYPSERPAADLAR